MGNMLKKEPAKTHREWQPCNDGIPQQPPLRPKKQSLKVLAKTNSKKQEIS